MDAVPTDYLTLTEAAQRAGLSRQFVYKLIVEGKLPARVVVRGGVAEWQIGRDAIDRYRAAPWRDRTGEGDGP